MSLYAAIDLHSTDSVLAVIDDQDKVVRRRRLPSQLRAIVDELKPFKSGLAAIAVESTYNWYWLVEGRKLVAVQ
jgi:transposase